MEEKSANQLMVDQAIDDVVANKPNVVESPRELIERVTNAFIKSKILDFPRMCDVAFMMNKQKQKELEEIGNKGRFTDSYGWSNDGQYLADYDIPQDLYNFMNIFVYKEFWGNDNERVWRGFMKKICRGMLAYEQMELFVKLKNYFGDTSFVHMRGHGANNSKSIEA